MNLKSITKRVSGFVTAVMRSWPPHHRCHPDNEKRQTENGTQPKDAGDKLFLRHSSVSPQPVYRFCFTERFSVIAYTRKEAEQKLVDAGVPKHVFKRIGITSIIECPVPAKELGQQT
jgi:hypothetical protein